MKVGIDLGTAFSAIARFDESTSDAVIIPNSDGLLLTPSVVRICGDGVSVGTQAYQALIRGEPGCTVDFKKNIGTDVQYRTAAGTSCTAKDIARELYLRLAEAAEGRTGERIEGAVVTVPAYFDDVQRRAVMEAAEKAGINVIKILNEPTAAAIFHSRRRGRDRTMLVYDIGGGTTDVTLCRIQGGNIEIIGAAGNNDVGGNRWDGILLDIVSRRFADLYGVSPADDPAVREELLSRAEAYKRLLSARDMIEFEIEYKGLRGSFPISRSELEEAGMPLLESTTDLFGSLVHGGMIFDPASVDEVLLTGGASRMPCVKRFLESKGFRSVIVSADADADTAVVRGAALSIGMTGDADSVPNLRDITSHSLGYITESPDGSEYVNTIVIPRFSPLPATGHGILRLKENNTSDRIDLFLVQGESADPSECTVLGKRTISGFDNLGCGMDIEVLMTYDINGIIRITAEHAGRALTVSADEGYGDISWLSEPPSQREIGRGIPKQVAYCIDLSKSMWKNLDKVKECLRSSSSILDDGNTTFSLIGFADSAKLICGPGADRKTMLGSMDGIRLGVFGLGRGTAADPFDLLNDALGGFDGARFAAIITDGSWECRDEAVEQAALCRKNNIIIYVFGIGDSVDRQFLNQIATMDGNAMRTDSDGLKLVTDTIAVAIKKGQTGLREAL